MNPTPAKASLLHHYLRGTPGEERNFLRALESIQRTHGDWVRTGWPRRVIWAFHPSAVTEILSDRFTSFEKGENYQRLRPLLGESVLTTDGEQWREQRKRIASGFHLSHIQAMFPQLRQVTQAALKIPAKGEPFGLHTFLSEWGVAMTATALFRGRRPPVRNAELTRCFSRAAVPVFLNSLLRIPPQRVRWTPWSLGLFQMMRMLHRWADEVIAQEKQDRAGGSSMLHKLIQDSPTEREARDQIVTLLLAGHDTTALTLFWLFSLLNQSPAERTVVELEARTVLSDSATYKAWLLRSDTAIDHAISEALRLYPAVTTVSRQATEDVLVCGERVKKGEVIQLVPWITHRHASIWGNAAEFRPSRFIDGDESSIPGAYFPFGLGPRACVGQALARVQMKILIAELYGRYRLEIGGNGIPRARPLLTLRPAVDRMAKLSPLGEQ